MKYLVTGATGFLGKHVASALEAHGHQVAPYSRSQGGDVRDGARVEQAAEGCDGAFHCAGRVSRKPEDAEEMYRVHVQGTKAVLDACRAAGVRRVVVASTSGTIAVGDDPDHVATENDDAPIGLVGRWPYYRAKLFAERAALERNGPGFEVLTVNPSLLLGPGDEGGASTEDVRRLLAGAIPAVPAGGLSFVDVRDAAEAMRLAMARGRPGHRYLVGACNLTVRDFFERVARAAGTPSRGPWMPMPKGRAVASAGAAWLERAAASLGVSTGVDATSVEMGQCFWYLDAVKAERELGWTPRDPNETIYDTVADLRARGVVWPAEDARVEHRSHRAG
jgi:dihydroflavonol-4-reductase